MNRAFPLINNEVNPYRDTVIGKANEPVTVAGLLYRAKQIIGSAYLGPRPDWSLGEIYNRLERNAPRIAIIGGSPDHPAHIMDFQTISYAAIRIWENGGVPFQFSTPVMCDGTAQDNQGMSYSLQSRNAVAQMVANQLEAHSYHGAFVIQGCDKQPLGVVSALAQIDRIRNVRGEAPFFATFSPAHVLKGGRIPDSLICELEEVAQRAERSGKAEIADDIRDTMDYVLVCSTNTFYQGVLERAKRGGIISDTEHKHLEKQLAVSTCDASGGVCAFNGTGNSSRHMVAGLGLVHPALELLTEPPTQRQVNQAIDSLAGMINDPAYGVANLMAANIKNAVRIHSASGGSSNLLMHMVAGMLYAGFKFTLADFDRIHHEYPIPDLFDYSLTQGRDIFSLARQCCDGESRGMETVFHELMQNGVPMNADAPTVAGTTWKERLANKTASLSAAFVKENPLILSVPRRPFSGVDVLAGNFFESAVVKISGMSTPQLDEFDKKAAFVLYFQNEPDANTHLLDVELLEKLKTEQVFSHESLLAMLKHNAPDAYDSLKQENYAMLFEGMAGNGSLKLAAVIAGQGPEAYGMPEMFTPLQHLNSNRKLKRLVTVISDGRYSGVTFGAAVGHMTPEAYRGGGLLYLQTGDLLYLGLRERKLQFLEQAAFRRGELDFNGFDAVLEERKALGEERLVHMRVRQRRIASCNRLTEHTDAANGVVPVIVAEEADLDYTRDLKYPSKIKGARGEQG